MPIKTSLPSLTPATERLKTTLTLISRGYSLPPEAAPGGAIMVYPWDAEVSEWVVESSEDAGFSARVVGRLTRLPPDVVERFVASELLLVMLVARSLANDGTLSYTPRCPHCGAEQARCTIKVPGNLGVLGQKAEGYPGYDVIKLPCGDELKVRPLLVGDVAKLTPDLGRRHGLSTAALQNMRSIMEVGGGTPENLEELVTYYKALPPVDVDFLRARLVELSPALDTLIPHVCDRVACRRHFRYNLGLNYDFFLPSL